MPTIEIVKSMNVGLQPLKALILYLLIIFMRNIDPGCDIIGNGSYSV